MIDKKQLIIDSSIKLFAKKGYHATSIQEIADQSNVSKGAFYLYFTSKEDLALAIFHTYFHTVWTKIEKIKQLDIPPEEKLKKQIEILFETLSSHKEYFMVAMRENISFGDQLEDFIHYMNKKSYQWAADSLTDMYDDRISPYTGDGVIQLEGLIQGYFKYIILHNLQVDASRLAEFIVCRVKDLIDGMVKTQQTSSVPVKPVFDQEPGEQKEKQQLIRGAIEEFNNILHTSSFSQHKKQQSIEAAEVLIKETEKENPNLVLIQGVLSYFQSIPETKNICKRIAGLLDLHLTK